MSILLALLAQVGPFATPGAPTVSPLPPEIVQRKEREKQQRQPAPTVPVEVRQSPPPPGELEQCLAAVKADPLQGLDAAQAWLQKSKGAQAAQAGHCLGVALGRLERWDEARDAFLAAREAAVPTDRVERARLGSMAGNAALADDDAEGALAALDAAHADAIATDDKPLAGDIAIDRARALVALKRDDAAATALAEARATLPGNAQAWLLSATLSRRMGKLAEAQAEIEKAAELLPVDPEIGLEAGVIAVLAGRDEAARKSWRSVIAAAPKSDAAQKARGYLEQIGEGSAATR